MKNLTKTIRVGTPVRLKRRLQPKGVRQVTVVRAFLPEIPGGVWLEEALDRSRGWNVQDLEPVKTQRKGGSMKFTVALAVLVATLSAVPQATTCAAPNAIPRGAVVTPGCTYVVEQVDPGLWRDNLNQLWAFIEGFSAAVRVGVYNVCFGPAGK